jgi:Curli production assembly/transport component CsgG
MKAYRLLCVMALLMMAVGMRAYAAPAAQAAPQDLTVAVLGFAAGESLPKDMGKDLSTLLAAYLSTDTNVQMVEREQLLKTLDEQGLSLSGMVSSSDAIHVGHLVGANVLVTGRAFSLGGDNMTIVVKIIGSETGRVYGRVVQSKGPQDADAAVKQLAGMVSDVLNQYGKSFLAATPSEKARIARITKAVAGLKLPQVTVLICEYNVGPVLIDPAAETEINYYLQACGVKLLDHDLALRKSWAAHFRQHGFGAALPGDMMQQADVVIVGEASSEFGMQEGNLISCKARVELKAVDTANGQILAVDRETAAGVDIAQSTAAKTAIQNAADILAERDIPLIIRNWDKAQAARAAAAKAKLKAEAGGK